jgi:hypothetical protein
MHYRLYKLDDAGRVRLAYAFEAANDSAALEEARQAGTANDVEVWQLDRLIARIKREDAA